MRRSGRSRQVLAEAVGWRQNGAMRLAHGPVRRLLADRAHRARRNAARCRSRPRRARHAGADADDQARHRRAQEGSWRGVRRVAGWCRISKYSSRSALSPQWRLAGWLAPWNAVLKGMSTCQALKFASYRLPPEVIGCTVGLYLRPPRGVE